MSTQVQRPLIVIGAGRSGSTLVVRILDCHPEIVFRSETSFLVPRLWLELWEDKFWIHGDQFVQSGPTSSRDPLPRLSEEIISHARDRAGKAVAELLCSLMGLDPSTDRVWGFKEPWNGSSTFQYEWTPYDFVFPGAVWVHLIRNPFEFSRSCAQWNREAWTAPYLEDRLQDWVSMLEWNRKRAACGRYFEIRFEDLLTDAEVTLTPILRSVGLEWNAACLEAMKIHTLQSRPGSHATSVTLRRMELEKIVDRVPGLHDALVALRYSTPEELLMDLFHGELDCTEDSPILDLRRGGLEATDSYHLPRHFLEEKARQVEILQNEVASLRERLGERDRSRRIMIPESLKGKSEIIVGPFVRDSGNCWVIELQHLEEYADHLDNPFQSPLVMLENDQPLAKSHAVHENIRRVGAGQYSHWKSHLYFSTSDNSDPNANGRIYAIRLL